MSCLLTNAVLNNYVLNQCINYITIPNTLLLYYYFKII